MRAFVLKTGATLLTVGATMVSSFYVAAHLKNPSAPLQPTVVNARSGTTATALGGTVSVGPSVRSSDAQAVTSTYAS